MDFSLRLLGDSDLPDLQRIYNGSPEVFRRLFGGPAAPDQAVRDFLDALRFPGRFQFGVIFHDNLIGVADCKLDDEEEGLAHIGMVLLSPPFDDQEILSLVARVLERWLATEYNVRRIEIGAPAGAPLEIAFWERQGYEFTGAQYRREMPARAPRFLVMAKDIG
jgi:RimJ/RimL family protein N-acetyltransferase